MGGNSGVIITKLTPTALRDMMEKNPVELLLEWFIIFAASFWIRLSSKSILSFDFGIETNPRWLSESLAQVQKVISFFGLRCFRAYGTTRLVVCFTKQNFLHIEHANTSICEQST